MSGYWANQFRQFFLKRGDDIATVMRVSGCREGWLQGELYRAFHHQKLALNSYPLGRRRTADFCCAEPHRKMVGELKIIAADHQSKMFFGSRGGRLRKILPKLAKWPIGRRFKSYASTGSGIVPDYYRLSRVRGTGTERLLILLTDANANSTTALGKALHSFKFDVDDLPPVPLGDWTVRMWHV